jgi:2-keto-4-pentenoate hydratase/2-oxohepta-3-ene-1,7-dioic acid hydratase in catechol pathway
MRFVTFTRKNEQRLGLMGPQDHIIDLAEVNRRFLKNGNASYLTSMQAFIEGGSKAIQVARQAEKYVTAKNIADQKKLVAAGALLRSNQARIIAPVPVPKKNVVMLGINYREHVDEGARARSLDIKYPDYPVFFTKPATSVIGQFGKSSIIKSLKN